MRHAVEHATSDLAGSVKIPGFRPGKVPARVLRARIGEERLLTEAVESHISGWFWNAAASTRIRPVAQPEYDYDLPASEDDEWSFTATVAVQPKPEVANWSTLEVPYAEAEVPSELVDQEIDALRESVASLPPADDELARAASEFDTYDELRADVDGALREQLEEELDAAFRAEAVDRLVDASNATASGPLVEARARELLNQLGRSLDRRGITADLYLQATSQTPEQLAEGVRAEAARSVARELVLEAAADKLGIEVPDEEVEELVREQADAAGEDAAEILTQLRETGRLETLRTDLRLKKDFDRIAA